MADLPSPESYEQLLGDMLSAYAAKLGINDFNVGSVNTSFFEVVALVTARASGDFFQILRDFSVDRATGDALKRLAAENNVTPISAKPTTGGVSVLDVSFSKISTKIYAGANPPNIGSSAIKVSDASAFSATGSVYIGRGTPNVEGPLPYSSISVSGGFYVINLSSPTTKFHNLGEAVILAQGGNRAIAVNTMALSPGVGSSADIQYSVGTAAVILDGEVQVDNVAVSALLPGSSGNVPAGAIKEFAQAPFSGATVTNPLPFTTGTDSETDDQLRVRIKRALASIGLGTATAVQAALIGATPSDENATIVSDSLQNNTDGSATVFIDDGTGYEAKTAGVGLESVVDSAIGGEQFFQLQTGGRQAPVAKAFLQSTLSAPFDIIGGDTLAVIVGGITYQHVFATSDFISPGGATAFEVTASINADTTLGFEATTAGGGQFVVIRAKSESNDDLQTTIPTTNGRDASVQLGLPANKVETLRLYKNSQPLSKDGATASLFTQAQNLWSSNIQNGDTLILSIDGTDPITFTFLNTDFISTGLYTSVAATNSLAAWVQVMNAKLTGVTAAIVGQQIEITSNLGANNRAAVVIDPSSTLVTKGMFSSSIGLSSSGKASDFTLDRNTAQFELVTPLSAGDKLAAGSENTQASVSSSEISGGQITFSADAHVWILIDNPGKIIATGVASNTLISVSKPATNVIRYTSNVSSAFANVLVGDYVVIWSTELDASVRLEGRVHAVTGTTIDLLVTPTEYAAATTTAGVVYQAGFIVLRSTLAPQKFRVQAGTKSLEQIAQELQNQSESLAFTVSQDEFLVVSTVTLDSTGSVLIVTADATGQLMNLPVAGSDASKESLVAFYDSQEYEADFPLFIHSTFAAGVAANPIDSFITSFQSTQSLSGRDPNELVSMLHPYGTIRDAQAYGEHTQETSISGSTVGVAGGSDIRRLRSIDRFFVANPLDFGHQDTAVVVLDNDTSNKSFEVPFYRRGIANTSYASNQYNFNAYDVDSGSMANFSAAFGAGFDFSNFKVLMQAKKVLKPSPNQTAILYRSVQWGRSGEKITIGYIYPSVANSPIGNTIAVGASVPIRINLKSGAPVTNSIDASTGWNVTIAANTPTAGIDQVTYTWNGQGTSPSMSLSGGEYVNISTQTGFSAANTGIFRISTQVGFTPTSTQFTVQRPTGVAVAESNKFTTVNGAITLYQSSATTANDIQAYVATNLPAYLTASVVNDSGTMGSGVIVLSTYEDSGFTFSSVALKDGINWISSSNLSSSPQFIFKTPLQLPTDVGYAFNNGEEVRLIPTTMDQVQRLISVLAVSGFTTIGNAFIVDRGTRLELATSVLGSGGAVQIIGGLANLYQVPVLDTATRLDNQYMSVSADSVAGQGVHSDQWFKLVATQIQNKISGLSSNTSVSTIGSSPQGGQSTVTLSGRLLTQRYFGKPRHHVRSRSNTFRVEKQGSLVCISWNGVGSNPLFSKPSLNFNDSGGGTLNVAVLNGSSEAQYSILTGNTNFTELSIGDLVTIAGLPVAANNGTFLVTGVSDNGKMIQVLNSAAQNEFSSGSFTLVTNSTAGDTFTVAGNNFIAGTNFTIGVDAVATAANLAATIAAIPQIASTANGNVVTIKGTSAGQAISLAYSGTGTVTVSGSGVTGDTFVAGNFSAASAVDEGDSVILGSPFSILNQGRFRIIRQNNNSIWIENANVVEEEVALPSNLISLGFDATTSFKANASNNSFYLNWNGIGTEPALGNAMMGDVLRIGTAFTSVNQGDYMVLRAGAKLQQIIQVTVPNGPQFATSGVGTYFTVNNAGNLNQYYVWFNVNAGLTDPAPGGLTGVQVPILNGDNIAAIAVKLATALNTGTTGLTAVASNGVVTITTTDSIETTLAANVSVPVPFGIQLTQAGRRTFLECINPSASSQSAVLVTSGVLECHRPQMQFSEYEAAVAGDKLVIAGSVLGASNAGSYSVVQVLSRDSAIVNGTLVNTSNVSLNGNETAVLVQEGVAYTGYKHAFLVASQPGAPTRDLIVFDSNEQYQKINDSAGVQIISQSKLNFNTTLRSGLDSYRYNTGLIAEANRIIYGDPRDPTTYPGVGAAGADIFVREPLTRRIQLSLDIRLLTGAPFNTVSQQVRSSVSSLINSNPVGQSIDISSILSVVRAIPGIQSVAIDSPQFDSSHDLIALSPGEKARIIDPTTDIAVDQIGN